MAPSAGEAVCRQRVFAEELVEEWFVDEVAGDGAEEADGELGDLVAVSEMGGEEGAQWGDEAAGEIAGAIAAVGDLTQEDALQRAVVCEEVEVGLCDAGGEWGAGGGVEGAGEVGGEGLLGGLDGGVVEGCFAAEVVVDHGGGDPCAPGDDVDRGGLSVVGKLGEGGVEDALSLGVSVWLHGVLNDRLTPVAALVNGVNVRCGGRERGKIGAT